MIEKLRPYALAASCVLLGAAMCGGGWWVLDRAATPAAPAPSPSVPDGVSVERVRAGERTVWCAINYNGGISCDFTREATP